jgi:hypothetical protein
MFAAHYLTHNQQQNILIPMSIRLQVLLDEEELEEIRRRAREEHISVSAWVRRALEHEKRERPSTAVRTKLELLHAASQNDYPAGDYAQMAAEISRSYLADIESHHASGSKRGE